jgi:hypothetical protein
VVRPFANEQVTLRTSLFTANRDRILEFLRGYPADRMLAVFRANAGLDTRGAQPPGGWETATTWVDSGLFTQEQRQEVIAAAARADLRP